MMIRGLKVLSLLAMVTACASTPPSTSFISGEDKPITFVSNAGDEVDAIEGSLQVPENRADPDSRMITLRYVRFPATGDVKGPPIVYLAGGPGGSGVGTAKWRRFPLFMAMRAYGDVIAFDQRGTGMSDQPPRCVSSVTAPTTDVISDDAFAELYRESIRECAVFWEEEGVDLAGYTTADSVADLRDLRQHLGAEQISLWGISYGSHLALAAMKEMPREIDRVMLASVEGLDQTVKLPSRTDAYFEALGEAAGVDDAPGLIRRVHDSLEAEPRLLDVPLPDGRVVPYLFQKRDMQMIASGMISDPSSGFQLLHLYGAMDAGVYEPIAGLLGRFVDPTEPISHRAMSRAMDRASGISRRRLAQVEKEAETSLLGAYLNFPMPQILGEWEDLDLGRSFRTDPRSDIPTLVLSGTLDGRTYPEGQKEATKGLANAAHVSVVGAGHNLFMFSPEVEAVMEDFMAGKPLRTNEITRPQE